MKKIIFALFLVVFAVSLCFAQESEKSSTSTSQSTPPVSQTATKSFTGKVNSVSVGNVDEGTKSQITITDDNGQNLIFVIETGILTADQITDQNGNILAPAGIKNGSKVTVTYTTDAADGTNKAQSIKVIQQEGDLPPLN